MDASILASVKYLSNAYSLTLTEAAVAVWLDVLRPIVTDADQLRRATLTMAQEWTGKPTPARLVSFYRAAWVPQPKLRLTGDLTPDERRRADRAREMTMRRYKRRTRP